MRNERIRQTNASLGMLAQDNDVLSTTYTMEAWLVDNPECCAYIKLWIYKKDDIKPADILSMREDLIGLFKTKLETRGHYAAFKLYDTRGVETSRLARVLL
jgi:hypothetical protein